MRGTAYGRSWAAALVLLRTWPAVWAVVGSWVVVAFLFAYVFPYLTYRTGSPGLAGLDVTTLVLELEMSPARAPDVAISAMPLFGGAMMTVLGVLVTGSGYAWGQWTTAATHTVSRRSLIGGSVGALSTLAAVLVAGVMTLDLVAATGIAALEDLEVEIPAASVWLGRFLAGLAVLEMWLLIGCALGVLCRATGLPLGLTLVWTLVVENLLRGVSVLLPGLHHLTDLLPGTASGSLVGAVSARSPGEVTPGVLTDLGGGRAAVTVALYGIGCVVLVHEVFARRDLT